MEKTLIPLEELASQNDLVLVDLCAINNSLDKPYPRSPVSIVDKIAKNEREAESSRLFRAVLQKGGNLYLIPSILGECNPNLGDYNYKKAIKRANKHESGSLFPKFHRTIRDGIRARRSLLDEFNSQGKIISAEGEMYNTFFQNYLPLQSAYSLSEPDYDLLITSIVLAKNKPNSIVILSNDFPLVKAWTDLRKADSPNIQNLNFYARVSFNGFSKMILCK